MASTRLGRYEIVRTLALGALTDLLLGRTRGLEGFQRHVAIKQLRPEFAIDPKCYEAFVNEARLAAVLHHHNIVQVHDIDQEGGQPYFAMEYVHGIDLRTLLTRLAKRNEQLPLQHVVAIVASAAAALHHAHEQHGPDGQPLNIVHCDVTPANILIGFDGNVKVVDFGIAKAAIMRATDPGVPKGQVPYMSPEMCAGKPVDRRSDVFSLGIVLYELSTVRRLFKGQTDFHTMSAICNAEVPRPSQYRRDIPPQLEQIMLKALARDPARRYQSAGDMSLELDKIASSVGVGATTTALASYMRLQFGDQKEPWLQHEEPPDDEDNEPTQVDFDGPASGLAPPPTESIQKLAIPKVIDASKGSPIAQARTVALTPSAPGQRADELPVRKRGPTQPPQLPPIPVVEDTDERARTAVKRVATHPVDALAPTDLVETLPRMQSPPRDATAIVTPLTAYANYRVPPRRASRAIWWVLAAMLIGGAAVGAFVLWPVAGVREPEALANEPPAVEQPPPAPPAAEKPEQPEQPEQPEAPEAPEARSGIQMTMRDYEEAKQKEAEQAAAREADKAALAAAAELERQAAEEKKQRAAEEKEREQIEKESAKEPVAKKPAPTKRTTAKAPAKRTVSKAAKTPAKKRTKTKAKTKPKWDPNDLFLDEK